MASSQLPAEGMVWQIQPERDEGFTLTGGAPQAWKGWRIRYRPLGSRGRWTAFLTDQDLTEMSIGDLQAFCTAHAETIAAARRPTS